MILIGWLLLSVVYAFWKQCNFQGKDSLIVEALTTHYYYSIFERGIYVILSIKNTTSRDRYRENNDLLQVFALERKFHRSKFIHFNNLVRFSAWNLTREDYKEKWDRCCVRVWEIEIESFGIIAKEFPSHCISRSFFFSFNTNPSFQYIRSCIGINLIISLLWYFSLLENYLHSVLLVENNIYSILLWFLWKIFGKI